MIILLDWNIAYIFQNMGVEWIDKFNINTCLKDL